MGNVFPSPLQPWSWGVTAHPGLSPRGAACPLPPLPKARCPSWGTSQAATLRPPPSSIRPKRCLGCPTLQPLAYRRMRWRRRTHSFPSANQQDQATPPAARAHPTSSHTPPPRRKRAPPAPRRAERGVPRNAGVEGAPCPAGVPLLRNVGSDHTKTPPDKELCHT